MIAVAGLFSSGAGKTHAIMQNCSATPPQQLRARGPGVKQMVRPHLVGQLFKESKSEMLVQRRLYTRNCWLIRLASGAVLASPQSVTPEESHGNEISVLFHIR